VAKFAEWRQIDSKAHDVPDFAVCHRPP
jgi:hypothetical protein